MDPSFLHVDSEDSDQTGRIPRMIWVFWERERENISVGFEPGTFKRKRDYNASLYLIL